MSKYSWWEFWFKYFSKVNSGSSESDNEGFNETREVVVDHFLYYLCLNVRYLRVCAITTGKFSWCKFYKIVSNKYLFWHQYNLESMICYICLIYCPLNLLFNRKHGHFWEEAGKLAEMSCLSGYSQRPQNPGMFPHILWGVCWTIDTYYSNRNSGSQVSCM